MSLPEQEENYLSSFFYCSQMTSHILVALNDHQHCYY